MEIEMLRKQLVREWGLDSSVEGGMQRARMEFEQKKKEEQRKQVEEKKRSRKKSLSFRRKNRKILVLRQQLRGRVPRIRHGERGSVVEFKNVFMEEER